MRPPRHDEGETDLASNEVHNAVVTIQLSGVYVDEVWTPIATINSSTSAPGKFLAVVVVT